MLSNAYFLAKFRFDTDENEPAKNLQKFADFAYYAQASAHRFLNFPGAYRADLAALPAAEAAAARSASARRARSASRSAVTFIRHFRQNLSKMHFSKMHFSKILQIFGGLVLGCIKTKFCKKICVRQHFSSSTRFASFCTAAISKFSQKIGLKKQQFS